MRKFFLSLLAVVGVLAGMAFNSFAYAAQITFDLTITPPTTREDDTPLLPSEIASYNVYYAVDTAVTMTSVPVEVLPGQNAQLVIDLAPNVNVYILQFGATTVDIDGVESSILSNITTNSYLVESTAPPQNAAVSVTVNSCVGCNITEQ